MKMIKKITKVSLVALSVILVYSHKALADLAPIPSPNRKKPSQIEPVNFYEYTMAQMEWYHFVIIGACLTLFVAGGVVLVSRAKNKSKGDQGSDKLK